MDTAQRLTKKYMLISTHPHTSRKSKIKTQNYTYQKNQHNQGATQLLNTNIAIPTS